MKTKKLYLKERKHLSLVVKLFGFICVNSSKYFFDINIKFKMKITLS